MNFELTRVEAPTMREALQKIRASLGSDAMIVSTRTFRRGGVLGVGGQEVVEVYAADTRSRIQNIQREQSNRSRLLGQADPESREAPDGPRPVARSTPFQDEADGEEELRERGRPGQGRQDVAGLRARTVDRPRHEHPFLRECHELLNSHDVDSRLAAHLLEEIAGLSLPTGYPDPARVRALVRSRLAKLFVQTPPAEERQKTRTLVLIGPTGVGKTTTIAKLAAKAKINERRSVGLITIDNFRIAAVDQLEKYAQIIGLPLIVATTPEELQAAVEEFRARSTDLIFVDSAGRSPRDELKMAELRDFLAAVPDTEVHLVVSTTIHGKTMLSVANRFAGVGFHRLILTKVDETISFGSLVSALVSIGRPVSYVTDGQNVPDDIVAADPERLADLVLKTNAL